MAPRLLKVVFTGPFQTGKSTLVNCLLRRCASPSGDRTNPTTAESLQFRSPCGRLLLVDTPGIDANAEHNDHAASALQTADVAVLVVPNSSQLGQPLQRLAASIARKCIPVAVAINCWHDRESNDPAAPHPTIPAIRSQLSLCGLRIGCFTPLNIEWAAASRQLLPTESLRQLRRRNPEFFPSFPAPPTIESLQHLEKASKIELLEKFLLPSPTESFAPGGLEHLTLLSRLLKLIKTML